MNKLDIKGTGVTVTFPDDAQFICMAVNNETKKLEAGGNSSAAQRIEFPLIALCYEIAALPEENRSWVAMQIIKKITEKAGLRTEIVNMEEPKWTT